MRLDETLNEVGNFSFALVAFVEIEVREKFKSRQRFQFSRIQFAKRHGPFRKQSMGNFALDHDFHLVMARVFTNIFKKLKYIFSRPFQYLQKMIPQVKQQSANLKHIVSLTACFEQFF